MIAIIGVDADDAANTASSDSYRGKDVFLVWPGGRSIKGIPFTAFVLTTKAFYATKGPAGRKTHQEVRDLMLTAQRSVLLEMGSRA